MFFVVSYYLYSNNIHIIMSIIDHFIQQKTMKNVTATLESYCCCFFHFILKGIPVNVSATSTISFIVFFQL